VGLVAAVFVAGGVAGEFWYEKEIGDVNSCIQRADNARAVILEKEAGDAATNAERAQCSANKAQGSANQADEDAGSAQHKADAVDTQAKQLAQGLSATQSGLSTAAQQLSGINAEAKALQADLLPRRLFLLRYEDGTSNVDVLKPIADTEVIVESIPDFEARKAAAEIADTLELGAHFKIVRTKITEEPAWDGVTIETYKGPPATDENEVVKEAGEEMGSVARAERLEAFLRANLWKDVAVGYARRGELTSKQLRIRVGFKPSPFFKLRTGAEALDEEAGNQLLLQFGLQPIDTISKKASIVEWGTTFPRKDK
jgi:hypothetical protein